jgi:hypothetical protein
MEISKDVYLEIGKLADDRTVLQMLSVNKKYNNPIYFKSIFDNRYPWLKDFAILYLNNGKSWKQFYIDMVLYLAKLKEEFDIDYYPNADFYPPQVYRLLTDKYTDNKFTITLIKENGINSLKNYYNARLYLTDSLGNRRSVDTALEGDLQSEYNIELSPILPGRSFKEMVFMYYLPSEVNTLFSAFSISFQFVSAETMQEHTNNPKDSFLLPIQYDVRDNKIYVTDSSGATFDLKQALEYFYWLYREYLNVIISYAFEERGNIPTEAIFDEDLVLDVSDDVLETLDYDNSLDLLLDTYYSIEVFMELFEVLKENGNKPIKIIDKEANSIQYFNILNVKF